MIKGIRVVQTSPAKPELEPEFNDWYDLVHIPEILAIPGFVNAHRYGLASGRPSSDVAKDVAIYELEARELTEPIAELQRPARAGLTQTSETLQCDPPPVSVLYEALDRHARGPGD